MASGMEKMFASMLGISTEDLMGTIVRLNNGVNFLFAAAQANNRKMDALLKRAGFSDEQIAELNNGPGNGSGAGSPASQHQRLDGNAGG